MNPRGAAGRTAGTGRPAGAEFSWPVRVYYQHTDAAGVVYHGRYLDFMEAARAEMIQCAGFDLGEMARRDGIVFVVHTLQITYHKPALLNDLLAVTARLLRAGGVRLVLEQRVKRGGEVLARAELALACVDAHKHRPIALPRALAVGLERYA
ncbi:MAG: tol-pal system-associated acyl-CoA thioesterase [Burkholderiales bacterium]|nr:tol-pal system-associated acyl-CoA thioesterase [Burkholderiales bacterium]